MDLENNFMMQTLSFIHVLKHLNSFIPFISILLNMLEKILFLLLFGTGQTES